MDDDDRNEPGHIGPRVDPHWLDVVRQVVMFGLGVWLIWYAATSNGHDIPFMVTGLCLFGLIPTERLVNRIKRQQGETK